MRRQLTRILEESTADDPMSLLKWTSKSTRTLAEELTRLGHPVSWVTVARLLHDMGYSLQANVKTKEGAQHPSRDAQFRYLTSGSNRFCERRLRWSRWTRRRKNSWGLSQCGPQLEAAGQARASVDLRLSAVGGREGDSVRNL